MLEDNNIMVENYNNTLKEKVLELLPEAGLLETSIGGLNLTRREKMNEITRCFHIPFIIVILQGCKNSIIGSEKVLYKEKECLVTSVELPVASYITDATPEKPFLAVSIPIDKYIISQLAVEIPPSKVNDISLKGIAVSGVEYYVLDAFSRLVDLVKNPEQAAVLAPMIIREIHYRLLIGPLGNQLRMINTFGTQSNQIAKSISWLKENYKEPLKIDDLAEKVNMAPSTFRRHFCQVTTLSPLQYQKRLRLHEAQRLMLMENENATSACYSVGYESPTQFNREYKRMFGEPPHKDVQKILAI